ncbi:MAG: glycosyl hydrolase [Eubacteriales bacterium]|nr:glycosyl hydrolase [Eubacteriales bacterium]
MPEYTEKDTEQLRGIFKDPPSGYRSAPFWSWNCRLDGAKMAGQIPVFKEMGFGGFHIHVRTGLDTEYLGEEYMQVVRECVKTAKAQGLYVWIYDEDRWSSGAAGGMVTKEIKYRQKYLLFTPDSYEKAGASEAGRGFLAQPSRACNGRLLARYDVSLDKQGYLTDYRILSPGETAHGEEWFAYLETERSNPWYNYQTYSDTLKREAVERFLEITHEAYNRAVGDEFGKTIPAFFTDEPQFSNKHVLPFPDSRTDVTLPWTDDLEEGFTQKYGQSLLGHLPELIWELPGDELSWIRYQYHDYVAGRFVEAFFETSMKWCQRHHVKLTGHLMEEPTLKSQCAAVGETMRAYSKMDLPGVDMLRRDMEYTTVKQAQSVSRQYGKGGVMSELYGVTGWDFDFRDYKFYGDWQAALGVTLRVPHLSWASMEGEAKRDFPASIFYQSPWYREFSYIEDHFARVSSIMIRGRAVTKIGVIHPIESYWLHWGPSAQTADVRNRLDENFQMLTEWLLFGKLDFDFLCESLLPEQCKPITGGLQVGEMFYEAILVPGCETLRTTTVEYLEEFQKNGGTLIFMGDIPKRMDARRSDRPGKLYQNSIHISFERTPVLNVLDKFRDVEIRDMEGMRDSRLLYQLREEFGRRWLFLAQGKEPYNKDISKCRRLQIQVKGSYKPIVWDTLTGDQKELPYTAADGWTIFQYQFFDYDSLLVELKNYKMIEKTEVCDRRDSQEKKHSIKIPETVRVHLGEPNVLLLDKAEYALDDEKYNEKTEILRLDNKCRERLGWSWRGMAIAQPWSVPAEEAFHTLKMRFTIYSELELDTLELALETPEKKQIQWNDRKVASRAEGWYVDPSIQKVRLSGLKKGCNILEIIQPFGKNTNTEWVYLLGDFGAALKGEEQRLINWDGTLGFGDITVQGLPYYGGELVYEIPFKNSGEEIEVCIPHYRAGVLKADIDGGKSQIVALPPYRAAFGHVMPGEHILRVIAYISRGNAFGPVHLADEKEEWFGPSAWRSHKDAWTESYRLKQEGLLSRIEIRE